jgi:IstB-like ATP binding protein
LAFEDRLALLATAKRPRRKSIGPRGLDKALFQKLVAGAPEPAHHRPDRRRKELDCLRARSQGLSG